MELIITQNTTVEEYQAWINHPDTTIRMIIEADKKWAKLIEGCLDRMQDALDSMMQHAFDVQQPEESIGIPLAIHVAEQEMKMEEVLNEALQILCIPNKKVVYSPYKISEDTSRSEIALINALEAKKFRSRVRGVIAKVALVLGTWLVSVHNLL